MQLAVRRAVRYGRAMPTSFHRLFIANRGEVAVRVARACDAMGIVPVFGVSEADRDAPYTRNRETVLLKPPVRERATTRLFLLQRDNRRRLALDRDRSGLAQSRH